MALFSKSTVASLTVLFVGTGIGAASSYDACDMSSKGCQVDRTEARAAAPARQVEEAKKSPDLIERFAQKTGASSGQKTIGDDDFDCYTGLEFDHSLEQIIAACTRLLAKDDQDRDAYLARADAYKYSGDNERASADYAKAKELKGATE